jgi:hypothetical protein
MSTILKDKTRGLRQPQKSNPFENRRKAYADKPLSSDPHAQNPVYSYKTSLRCEFCGSRKRFSNAWKLYMHFKCHHASEPSLLSVIRKIADSIIGEMK